MRVQYIEWGLANFYPDHIELNIGLKDNKPLRDYVMRHELGHKEGFDLAHEFDIKPQIPSLFWFVLTHPKTWIDFSPLQYKNKQIVYDFNILMLYGLCLILLAVLIFVIKLY